MSSCSVFEASCLKMLGGNEGSTLKLHVQLLFTRSQSAVGWGMTLKNIALIIGLLASINTASAQYFRTCFSLAKREANTNGTKIVTVGRYATAHLTASVAFNRDYSTKDVVLAYTPHNATISAVHIPTGVVHPLFKIINAKGISTTNCAEFIGQLRPVSNTITPDFGVFSTNDVLNIAGTVRQSTDDGLIVSYKLCADIQAVFYDGTNAITRATGRLTTGSRITSFGPQ